MPLFRTILLAADFSEQSRAAFVAACSLAHETKSRLIVLHVAETLPRMEQPAAFGEAGAPKIGAGALPAQDEATEARLRGFYVPHRPLDVAYQVRDGGAADAILRMADEIGADLIAMGTHGRTGLNRLFAGSVAEAVLRRSHCPVLALRSPHREHANEAIRVIVHPTDFSEHADLALQVARSLARENGAHLILLFANPLPITLGDTFELPPDPMLFQELLDERRRRVEGPDLKFPVETYMRPGHPAAVTLDLAEEVRCDLIVMGTHGRSGLGRLLVGSVAEEVVRRADCPVLTIKAKVSGVAAPPGMETA